MKLLVVGAGMYVTGRNESGQGTILCSIAQFSKGSEIEKLTVASRSESSGADVDKSLNRINSILGSKIEADYVQLQSAEESSKLFEQYDAVIISVPDHLHYSYAKAALESNLHCLLVKPFTPTTKEAQSLIKLASDKDVHACVEFHKRFDRANLHVARVLRSGELGDPIYFAVDYSQRVSIPTETFKGWASKSNIFQYLGVHYVDLIYFLSGYLPVKAQAIGTKQLLVNSGVETYDSVHAQIVWESASDPSKQCVSVFNTNWVDPLKSTAMSDQKYRVVGTAGRIDCDQKNRGVEQVIAKAEQINPYFSQFYSSPDGGSDFGGYGYESIRQFLADTQSLLVGSMAAKEIRCKRPSFQESLPSVAVTEAVNQSLSSDNNWVDIDRALFR